MDKNYRDYEKIIHIYNTAGSKAASEFLTSEYGLKKPLCFITKIKHNPEYQYNEQTKKFDSILKSEKPLFMEMNELCKSPPLAEKTPEHKTREPSADINSLIQDLIQEKLLELSRYVQINRYSGTVNIDKTGLLSEGYIIEIH